MSHAALIYPHHLFDPHPALRGAAGVVLVEEPLLFRQYAFHQQKLIFHRATMKRYAARLSESAGPSGVERRPVHYIESAQIEDTGAIADHRSEERRVGKEGRSRWSPYH